MTARANDARGCPDRAPRVPERACDSRAASGIVGVPFGSRCCRLSLADLAIGVASCGARVSPGSCCWRLSASARGWLRRRATAPTPFPSCRLVRRSTDCTPSAITWKTTPATPVTLRGVNRSGTEYMCVKGGAVFDGAWGLSAIAAIASWKANVVRIPLNETCWLGPQGRGRRRLQGLDRSLRQHAPPVSHRSDPRAALGRARRDDRADEQQPMPDADHAVDFWTDVATTYANDDGVVFELYNEPFPDSNKDSTAGLAMLARRLHGDALGAERQRQHGDHAPPIRRSAWRRWSARCARWRRTI